MAFMSLFSSKISFGLVKSNITEVILLLKSKKTEVILCNSERCRSSNIKYVPKRISCNKITLVILFLKSDERNEKDQNPTM